MAFPGGHFQQADGDLLQTVLRETREEVGLDIANRTIGRLPEAQPRNQPTLLVVPFAALWEERPRIQLSKEELVGYFWAGLKELEDSAEPRLITQIGRQMDSYLCEGHIVWGLTARILSDLFRLAGT